MNRIKRCVAAAVLGISLGGGGALLAANTGMLAFTADAGMPASGGGGVDRDCTFWNPCAMK